MEAFIRIWRAVFYIGMFVLTAIVSAMDLQCGKPLHALVLWLFYAAIVKAVNEYLERC